MVGLATYNVARRKKEIVIRRVFGASATNLLWSLGKEFVLLAALASVFAIPLVWYSASQWLSDFAYGINMPWWIFGATCASVVTLIAFIIWLQGMKTISTNPTQTMRSE